MPGWKAVGVNGELEKRILCSGCKYLLKNAYQTGCGHRYCEDCLFQTPTMVQCCEADCNHVIVLDECFADRAIQRELNCVKVRCKLGNCVYIGDFPDYVTHYEVCEYRQVPCPNVGCDSLLVNSEVSLHAQRDCLYRVTYCQYCRGEHIATDMSRHHQSCPDILVTCPYCREYKAPRNTMEDHVNTTCPNVQVPCSYQKYGCGWKNNRKELKKHYITDVHSHLQLVTTSHETLEGVVQDAAENGVSEGVSEYRDTAQNLETILRRLNQLEFDQQVWKKSHSLPTATELGARGVVGGREYLLTDNTGHEVDLRDTVLEVRCLRKEVNEMKCDPPPPRVMTPPLMNINRRQEVPENVLSYDGTLLWKVSEVDRFHTEAQLDQRKSLYSPPFYTSRNGYRMCARLYLSGDGDGRGNHLSLFFVLMMGKCDALLTWPFTQKVRLVLLDQDGCQNIEESFLPDPNSSSFLRPTREMNVASGCPLFAPSSVLTSAVPAYVKDDTLFIRIIVDTTNLSEV